MHRRQKEEDKAIDVFFGFGITINSEAKSTHNSAWLTDQLSMTINSYLNTTSNLVILLGQFANQLKHPRKTLSEVKNKKTNMSWLLSLQILAYFAC